MRYSLPELPADYLGALCADFRPDRIRAVNGAGIHPPEKKYSKEMGMHRLITSISLVTMLALILGACSDDETAFSAPDCSTGTVSSTFSSDTPTWISDNFTCVEVSVSGDNYIIKTRDTPPFTTVYYGVGHALYDAATAGVVTNSNIISAKTYTFDCGYDRWRRRLFV